jgi:gas vesicle protein
MSEPESKALENAEEQTVNRLAWFLVGVVIGAGAAILYAPKSGRDTRLLIAQKTNEGREAVETAGHDVVERSRDLFVKGRQLVDDAADLFERGRKLVRG